MFVINDIELLERLSKHRILSYLAERCTLSISGIRLSDYSLKVRQVIAALKEVTVLNIEKEDFDAWITGRRKYLTISDLSSIYLTLCNQSAVLVLSPEDQFLVSEAKKCGVAYLQFDDFFIRMIKDEKIIQLYNLVKVA
jgi:hypothetical protein